MITAALLFTVSAHVGTQPSLCTAARELLAERLQMAAIVDADTVDDWRTRKLTPGCRVTAAGLTRVGIRQEALRFYEHVRAAGWVRTPDPFDAPNEASLRFRHGSVDCLFNVYEGFLLNTDAELRVADERYPKAGESRYHVFAMCVPAAPAAPRS